MAKRIFVALTIGIFCAAAGPAARAQAVAESAIMHANSGISGSVARALGGNIQQGLSKTQGQFAYPPRTSRTARHARAYRASRKHSAGPSSIAISSVVGAPASCPTTPAAAQAKPTGSASGNCAAKTPPPPAAAKSNPNEITVSF